MESLDGMQLLRHVTHNRRSRKSLDNTVLVALLTGNSDSDQSHSGNNRGRHVSRENHRRKSIFNLWTTYMDAGAADVMTSPFNASRAESLTAHVYSFQKGSNRRSSSTAKRKTSWVGVGDSRPFAYLREVMVSGLMDRICDPEYVDERIDPQ